MVSISRIGAIGGIGAKTRKNPVYRRNSEEGGANPRHWMPRYTELIISKPNERIGVLTPVSGQACSPQSTIYSQRPTNNFISFERLHDFDEGTVAGGIPSRGVETERGRRI